MAIRTAVLSCIHGNLEALEAVLEDAAKQAVERTVCLGDMVGFGADPAACVERVISSCEWCLEGDFEERLLMARGNKLKNFNPAARNHMRWNAKQLAPGVFPGARRTGMLNTWAWLASLTPRRVEESALFVHGTPDDPLHEWLNISEATGIGPKGLQKQLKHVDGVCMHGHTHQPCVIMESGECMWPPSADWEYVLEPGKKVLINVGSVGQPRDEDPRACYAIIEDGSVRIRRVEYDIQRAAGKIRAEKSLDPRFAERLFIGR
ncbi:MAG: metallophosphoesterase family protein [Planctomycetes bacterium]|nr:metallophosphoesterase family protein [Planctomycetota bacterium]